MSSNLNEYELIRLVESYPILYDKSLSRGQRNGEMKDKAWKEVSVRLHASERACITRWKSIRDRFGKEFRRVQENPDEPIYWEMFQNLLFLKDHYKNGHASNETLTIKYEPKERRRKMRGTFSQEDESNNEEDVDPEEILINQQLIALVKEHPVLYDKQKIRDSKNLTAKSDAWREISETLGISEESCYKRWKKMRDRFAREYRYHQLSPQKPVVWIYFQELMFLEGHYRKGIPLNIENLKRKTVPADRECHVTETTETVWGDDYPFECTTNDDEQPMLENSEQYADIQQSLDELLIIPTKKPALELTNTATLCSETTTTTLLASLTEPEEKLSSVIANMEAVLRQSQDCLKSLQQQTEQHKEELSTNSLTAQPSMLQKVHVLLDGLRDDERMKAERKILQFLCECQIKSLNNQEVEDVCSVQIY